LKDNSGKLSIAADISCLYVSLGGKYLFKIGHGYLNSTQGKNKTKKKTFISLKKKFLGKKKRKITSTRKLFNSS
jgi:hypothetical protein